MKINLCEGKVFEEVNDEFFIRVPIANIASSDSARSISCWIPDTAKRALRAFVLKRSAQSFKKVFAPAGAFAAPEPAKPFLFVIVELAPKSGDRVFSVSDTIVFAGGDILALMDPVASFGLPTYRRDQSEPPQTPDGRH